MANVEVERELKKTESLLRFTKQHHAVIVSQLQKEVTDLRQKISGLNFKVHMIENPKACAKEEQRKTDSREGQQASEVRHLHAEVQDLRNSNNELKMSLACAEHQLGEKFCQACGGKMSARVETGDRADDKIQNENGLVTSVSIKHQQLSMSQEASQRPALKDVATPSPLSGDSRGRLSLTHSKSRSVPSGVVATGSGRRRLPSLPSDAATAAATSGTLMTAGDGSFASSVVPRPPTTPRPENCRRASPRIPLLKSKSLPFIGTELNALEEEFEDLFGTFPRKKIWELPVSLQLRAATVQYLRAVQLHKRYPTSANLPNLPKQKTVQDYLISLGLLSADGKQQIAAEPPNRHILPPLVPSTSSSASAAASVQDRNAYAGPRLANHSKIRQAAKMRNAMVGSVGASGSHSAVDLLAEGDLVPTSHRESGAEEDWHCAREHFLHEDASQSVYSPRTYDRSAVSKRLSYPLSPREQRHQQGQQRSLQRRMRRGKAFSVDAVVSGITNAPHDDTDLNATALSDVGRTPPLSQTSTVSRNASISPLRKQSSVVSLQAKRDGLSRVLNSPYMAQHSNKFAARTTIRERPIQHSQEPAVPGKDLSKSKTPSELVKKSR